MELKKIKLSQSHSKESKIKLVDLDDVERAKKERKRAATAARAAPKVYSTSQDEKQEPDIISDNPNTTVAPQSLPMQSQISSSPDSSDIPISPASSPVI